MLQSAEDADTPLTIQLKKLTSQILVISGAAVGISIALNLSRGESFDTVFTAAIAFAISAIPTGSRPSSRRSCHTGRRCSRRRTRS